MKKSKLTDLFIYKKQTKQKTSSRHNETKIWPHLTFGFCGTEQPLGLLQDRSTSDQFNKKTLYLYNPNCIICQLFIYTVIILSDRRRPIFFLIRGTYHINSADAWHIVGERKSLNLKDLQVLYTIKLNDTMMYWASTENYCCIIDLSCVSTLTMHYKLIVHGYLYYWYSTLVQSYHKTWM